MSAVTTSGQIVTLRGDDELLARAGHLFEPRTEIVCAAVTLSTWAGPSPRQTAVQVLRKRVAEGVRVQKMYNPAALENPTDAQHIRELAAVGIPIRICPTALPHETIVIDRKIAIVAGTPVDGVRSYSVITAPEVVSGVRSLFHATWTGATAVQDFLPPVIDEQGLTILRHLSSGQKDETAARAMGVSVRTYRRRVAELMALLGAESRFQAGERARALGLRW